MNYIVLFVFYSTFNTFSVLVIHVSSIQLSIFVISEDVEAHE